MIIAKLQRISRQWGCANQHIWCLSQAKTNWEGCSRKGIQCKEWGMMQVGHSLIPMEWHPAGLSVCLPLISSLAPQSPEEDFFCHWLTRVVTEKGQYNGRGVCACVWLKYPPLCDTNLNSLMYSATWSDDVKCNTFSTILLRHFTHKLMQFTPHGQRHLTTQRPFIPHQFTRSFANFWCHWCIQIRG